MKLPYSPHLVPVITIFWANEENAGWIATLTIAYKKFAQDTEEQSSACQWLRQQSGSFLQKAFRNLFIDVSINLDDTLNN